MDIRRGVRPLLLHVLRELPAGPSLLLQQKIETVDMDMLPPVDLLSPTPVRDFRVQDGSA